MSAFLDRLRLGDELSDGEGEELGNSWEDEEDDLHSENDRKGELDFDEEIRDDWNVDDQEESENEENEEFQTPTFSSTKLKAPANGVPSSREFDEILKKLGRLESEVSVLKSDTLKWTPQRGAKRMVRKGNAIEEFAAGPLNSSRVQVPSICVCPLAARQMARDRARLLTDLDTVGAREMLAWKQVQDVARFSEADGPIDQATKRVEDLRKRIAQASKICRADEKEAEKAKAFLEKAKDHKKQIKAFASEVLQSGEQLKEMEEELKGGNDEVDTLKKKLEMERERLIVLESEVEATEDSLTKTQLQIDKEERGFQEEEQTWEERMESMKEMEETNDGLLQDLSPMKRGMGEVEEACVDEHKMKDDLEEVSKKLSEELEEMKESLERVEKAQAEQQRQLAEGEASLASRQRALRTRKLELDNALALTEKKSNDLQEKRKKIEETLEEINQQKSEQDLLSHSVRLTQLFSAEEELKKRISSLEKANVDAEEKVKLHNVQVEALEKELDEG